MVVFFKRTALSLVLATAMLSTSLPVMAQTAPLHIRVGQSLKWVPLGLSGLPLYNPSKQQEPLNRKNEHLNASSTTTSNTTSETNEVKPPSKEETKSANTASGSAVFNLFHPTLSPSTQITGSSSANITTTNSTNTSTEVKPPSKEEAKLANTPKDASAQTSSTPTPQTTPQAQASVEEKHPYHFDYKLPTGQVPWIPTRGLANAGNSCYVSSLMQCLFVITPLMVDISTMHESKDPVVENFRQLVQEKIAQAGTNLTCHNYPQNLYQSIRMEIFNSDTYPQDDAYLFFTGLTTALGNQANVFKNTNTSTVTCTPYNHKSAPNNVDEPCLSLAIPEKETTESTVPLLRAINNYLPTKEALKERDSKTQELKDTYTCISCGMTGVAALKDTYLRTLPAVLVINLKRFIKNYTEKNTTPITIPYEFNLQTTYPSEQGSPATPYHLASVVIHHGKAINGGHYTALVKNPGNQTWYECNDRTVTQLANVDQLQTLGYWNNWITREADKSSTPTILFYVRNDVITRYADANKQAYTQAVTQQQQALINNTSTQANNNSTTSGNTGKTAAATNTQTTPTTNQTNTPQRSSDKDYAAVMAVLKTTGERAFRNFNLAGKNLSGLDLTGADLSGADLTGATMTGTNCTRANLTGTNLTGTQLERTIFDGAILNNTNFSGAWITDVTFGRCRNPQITGLNFTNAHLTRVTFNDINGNDFNFSGAQIATLNIQRCSLDAPNFNDANINNDSSIRDTYFYETELHDTILSASTFDNVHFYGIRAMPTKQLAKNQEAHITDVIFRNLYIHQESMWHEGRLRQTLRKNSFEGIQIAHCSFVESQINDCNFSRSHFFECTFSTVIFHDDLFEQRAHIEQCRFGGRCRFDHVSFIRARLIGLRIIDAILDNVDLSEAYLENVFIDFPRNPNHNNPGNVINLEYATLSRCHIIGSCEDRGRINQRLEDIKLPYTIGKTVIKDLAMGNNLDDVSRLYRIAYNNTNPDYYTILEYVRFRGCTIQNSFIRNIKFIESQGEDQIISAYRTSFRNVRFISTALRRVATDLIDYQRASFLKQPFLGSQEECIRLNEARISYTAEARLRDRGALVDEAEATRFEDQYQGIREVDILEQLWRELEVTALKAGANALLRTAITAALA